jgi:hypothetical protein
MDGFVERPEDCADMFFDHVKFLFGADAPRFIQWLAHIEQYPNVLPHSGWLHVAKNFGMGRNFISSVLARLWAGYTACNVDLPGILRTGFNGQLSRKLIAVVDEINEGTGDKWAHNEKMKSIINEERRTINPKYGRQSIEFNACRWLLFSNHLSAIPLEENDRRWNVSICDEPPKSAAYYKQIYGMLSNARLRAVDLSDFNPGAHAVNNDDKQRVRRASLSEIDERAMELRDYWPTDLIDHKQLSLVLTGFEGGSRKPAVRHVIDRLGFKSVARSVRVTPADVRKVIAIRNTDTWTGGLVEMQKMIEQMTTMDKALEECRDLLAQEGITFSDLQNAQAARFLLLREQNRKENEQAKPSLDH